MRIQSMMFMRDRYLRKFNRSGSDDMEYLHIKFRKKVVSEIRRNSNMKKM